MKFHFYNGTYVGSAEWRSPGEVAFDVADAHRAFLERYFGTEDAHLGGAVDCPQMSFERRDSSEEAFARAAYELAAYAYDVRPISGHRAPERTGAT